MLKKKLLMVVGAGASHEFGMPSVADVHSIINAAVQKKYPLTKDPRTNLYEHIEGLVKTHWTNNVPSYLYRDPHFEDILYALFALAAAYPAAADTSSIGALVTPVAFPEFTPPWRKSQPVQPTDLSRLAADAVDTILNEFRTRCINVETAKRNEFSRLQKFLNALQSEFDIAVITMNYDNIVYRALQGIETGFDPADGQFKEDRILNRGDWPCMLHLHGSVHFNMVGSGGNLHEITWQPNIRSTFTQNASGRSRLSSVEGPEYPNSAIVAGYGKTTQILRRPFRTYYSLVDRLVLNCDAVMFAGYGFGDMHLNIAFERFRDSRNRPVVILGFANDSAMTLAGADIGDRSPFVTNLIHTFQTDYKTMTSLGSTSPDTVAELRQAREFEVCSNRSTPLAMWYNGMLEACDNGQKVIAQLV